MSRAAARGAEEGRRAVSGAAPDALPRRPRASERERTPMPVSAPADPAAAPAARARPPTPAPGRGTSGATRPEGREEAGGNLGSARLAATHPGTAPQRPRQGVPWPIRVAALGAPFAAWPAKGVCPPPWFVKGRDEQHGQWGRFTAAARALAASLARWVEAAVAAASLGPSRLGPGQGRGHRAAHPPPRNDPQRGVTCNVATGGLVDFRPQDLADPPPARHRTRRCSVFPTSNGCDFSFRENPSRVSLSLFYHAL